MTRKLLITLPLLLLGLSVYSESTPCNLTDEGVFINGITWATRNVDAPGTFAESPESFGMLFQWNRRNGWNTVDRHVEDWDSSFPEGDSWESENDPCPPGWRVPTLAEFGYLFRSGSVWRVRNGVTGRLFGVEPYQIFLPTAGWRRGSTGVHGSTGSWGNYWTNEQEDSEYAVQLYFDSRGKGWNKDFRTTGLSVRCVAKDNQLFI